ncbi:HAD-IA family hydrolase [Neptuniibacter pectenicola]|jgi:phosphoglycolate phosphatase|uniref:HAD-IA family hydrolase n=1 Tax=Neptuniibacter pectenicola TaxID=1806669 RepID=A0ABU9TMF5_9GAMM|tara:strand:+ start:8791 stop:9474 length:684 start_codon:yes stop_codon:yes gene_type:complete
MNTRPASVLFDLDGTLIDTAPDFHWVINQLLKEENKAPVSYDYIRHYVSNGARAMVGAAFNLHEDDHAFDYLHQRMLELYLQHLNTQSQLFPGLDDCLIWLEQHNIPWGVVTNKPALYTTPVMLGLGLSKRVSTVICPDHVKNKKPDPEALFLACDEINCPAEQSIYVGDHIRDIEAGNRAGMTTVGATYGYLNDGEDPSTWHADHYITCATKLKPLLQSLYSDLRS